MTQTNGDKKDNFGIIVCVPSRGEVRMEWALMFRDLALPLNCSYVIRTIVAKEVVEARNIAVQDAIEKDAEFLCFLDDDVMVPNASLHRMFYEMRQNPTWDLITGIVTTKTIQPEPCIFRNDTPGAFWDWTFPDVFPIDACGMAFCLIRMEKVKQMDEPWFDWPRGYDGEVYREEGEDIYFCRRLREMGGVLMADGGVLCGHINDKGEVISLKETDPPIKNAADGAFKGARVLG